MANAPSDSLQPSNHTPQRRNNIFTLMCGSMLILVLQALAGIAAVTCGQTVALLVGIVVSLQAFMYLSDKDEKLLMGAAGVGFVATFVLSIFVPDYIRYSNLKISPPMSVTEAPSFGHFDAFQLTDACLHFCVKGSDSKTYRDAKERTRTMDYVAVPMMPPQATRQTLIPAWALLKGNGLIKQIERQHRPAQEITFQVVSDRLGPKVTPRAMQAIRVAPRDIRDYASAIQEARNHYRLRSAPNCIYLEPTDNIAGQAQTLWSRIIVALIGAHLLWLGIFIANRFGLEL